MAGRSDEKTGKDKRVELLSISAGWVVSICRFTHVFQSCVCHQCSYTDSQVFFFSFLSSQSCMYVCVCGNPPVGDVSQSRTVCGRCRSITAAVLSDEPPDSRGQLKLTLLIELNHVWRRFYFGQEKNYIYNDELQKHLWMETGAAVEQPFFPFAAILWFPVQKYEDSEIVLYSLRQSSRLEKGG